VAIFFSFLALTALVYGVVIVSLPGPILEEQMEVPMNRFN
jgi:hypothetical protein